MGVDYQGLRFLLFAARAGVSFNTPLMFGRQNFADVSERELFTVLRNFGHPIELSAAKKWLDGRYIEPLLEKMSATNITSIDASDYENASFIHDLNLPLPEQMKNKYTVAIDFGTLEHVFNYPQALKNAMETVALGGHFLAATVCNGFIGHGFYQFSPELFFRVFSPENGFDLEYQFICRAGKGKKWYRCIDPKLLKHRVEIVNACPTYLLVQARRTRICEIFSKPPQQSDYVSVWMGADAGQIRKGVSTKSWKQLVPEPIKRPVRRAANAYRRQYFKDLKINHPAFQLFSPEGKS